MRILKLALLLPVISLPLEAAELHTYPEPIVRYQIFDGKIVHKSVCNGYSQGSLQYRACRRKAKLSFKEDCQKHKNKYDRSRGERRKDLKLLKDRYCFAARNFRI
jgi:hypothetical protein